MTVLAQSSLFCSLGHGLLELLEGYAVAVLDVELCYELLPYSLRVLVAERIITKSIDYFLLAYVVVSALVN